MYDRAIGAAQLCRSDGAMQAYRRKPNLRSTTWLGRRPSTGSSGLRRHLPTLRRPLLSALLLVCSCSSPWVGENGRFRETADDIFWSYLALEPTYAVYLGAHEFDGRLPDVSDASLRARPAQLRRWLQRLDDFDSADLTPTERLERASLARELRTMLFELVVLERPWKDPLYYRWHLSVANYVIRDYRPKADRARAIISVAEGLPGLIENARHNLDSPLARPLVQEALAQVRGAILFLDEGVRPQMADLADPELAEAFDLALARMRSVLGDYEAFLRSSLERAHDHFALGREAFVQMLEETEGLRVELEVLEAAGRRELERTQDALRAAALEIDRAAPTRIVVQRVLADRPSPDEVLDVAQRQTRELRAFLEDSEVVSLPPSSSSPAFQEIEVRPTPAFMRWSIAWLDEAGPLEQKRLPSFYYVTLPEPSWPERVRDTFLPSRSELLSISIHEVWPGHFLQALRARTMGSRITVAFPSYTTSEGWAHYAEEMMFEAGLRGGAARDRIGMLSAALLRSVRLVAAIGMHVRGMSLREAEALFVEVAYLSPARARIEARRGTFDPLYLNYTLGKLMIAKLRADWRSCVGAEADLRLFHDTFLAHGPAPIAAIRRSMLGGDGGAAL